MPGIRPDGMGGGSGLKPHPGWPGLQHALSMLAPAAAPVAAAAVAGHPMVNPAVGVLTNLINTAYIPGTGIAGLQQALPQVSSTDADAIVNPAAA